MLLPVSGNQSTELESPTKRPNKSRSLKSRVKSSLSNLTPIRRTLLLLVILFHISLVLYLTRTHNPSQSFSNISSNTYSSLPRKSCHSRRIYVYDLPPTFNNDLLTSSNTNLNNSFGLPARELDGIVPESILPAWYWTDHYWGEVVYHNLMLNYKCRTLEPESATAFYIPFYAGIALRMYSWGSYNATDRGWHPEKLNKWLQEQKWWKRSKGSDHIIMLGRITWDFRRSREASDAEWGSSLLNLPAMENVVRLAIERNVWDNLEIAVPYPTAFHPSSESDITGWQGFVRSRRRNHLLAFVGDAREWIENDFRGVLKNKCLKESTACRHVDCGRENCIEGKTAVMEAFLDSDFCLQPRGAGFTGQSVFECMLAGSIPVFFWERTAYMQYELFLPSEPESYSVFIRRNDVRNGSTDIRRVLEGFGRAEVERLREKVIEHIPRFVYAKPSQRFRKMRDAFDFAIDGVLSKYKSHMERGRTANRDEI
ncbi:hypothetical protein RHMOL_Rhmol10G0136500 [Rhododendron molle]|uniref:Uncharacterized protein n=1 Tax=Rhododendron molle TaxID=49168 RepID=A0ACC0M1L7_RHOML|nr:hypothetical protein RHMOL_Rhmol10G0136500 [Rhododendron molle]